MNITYKNNGSSIKRTRSITSMNISKYIKILSDIDNKIDVYDYFLHERPFTNQKIIFNQQIIWCDKASLSSASPILREQLLKMSKNESLIFNDIDLKDFLSMLEFIYPIFNPEINETNISCLIELSYRFQFDMLKHACQIYVMKYLNTIRCVFNNYHNIQAEGDYIVNNNNENEHRQHDLIQFHNRMCIDAFDIIIKLIRWLKIYYKNDSIQLIEAIISILQKISVDYLEQAMTIVDINDEIKAYIYKQRAHYLEQIIRIKYIV